MKSRKVYYAAAILIFLVLCIVFSYVLSLNQSPKSPPVNLIEPTKVEQIPPTPTPLPVVEPTKNLFERCVPASEAQKEAIRSGIKSVQSSNDIGIAYAVKSGDFEKVWMVAAEITGQGIAKGDAIGVWAISGEQDTPGMILSVDGFATEFSPYPDGSKTDANTNLMDDGVQEAKACVEAEISK